MLEEDGPSRDYYEVLARRARPQTFSEVVGQEHVTRTLVNAIRTGRLAHAFVFSGMRGVGKTTTARILAKALNCEKGPTPEPCNACKACVEISEGRSLDVLEVDAASQTGIDATRELLETVKYQPAAGRYRVYIIDEAHGLSKQAVDAFLKTLEEPPEHAKFILATTAPQKLTSTILSRCQRYDFRAVPGDTIVTTLAAMVRGEGMEAEDEALAAIARESGGSLRDATSLLDQVLAFSEGTVDAAAVGLALGLPDVAAVRETFDAIVRRDAPRVLEALSQVVSQGADVARFAQDLLQRLRNLTVLVVAGPKALADLTTYEVEELETAREGLVAEDLQRWFRILLGACEELGRTPQPRLVLEMALLRMATLQPLVPLDSLVARLEALERGGGGPRGGTPPRVGGTGRPGRSAAPSPNAPARGGEARGSKAARGGAPQSGTVTAPAATEDASVASPAPGGGESLDSPAPGGRESLDSPVADQQDHAIERGRTPPRDGERHAAGTARSAAKAPPPPDGPDGGSGRKGGGSPRRPPSKAAGAGSDAEPRSPGAVIASNGATAAGAAAALAPEPSPTAGVAPELQRHWQSVVSELQRKQTARFFRLAYSEVVALRGDTLRVAVTSQAAAEELNRSETRRLIEEALTGEMGRAMRFEPVAGKGGAGEPGKAADAAQSIDRQAREDPVVRLSMEVLDGTFEGVVARSRREGA